MTAPDTKIGHDEELPGGTGTNSDGPPVLGIVKDAEVVADSGPETEAAKDAELVVPPVLVVMPD